MAQRRGLTILELVVVVVVVLVALAFVVGMLLPQLAWKRDSSLIKDGSQIRGIHQSWLIYSREFAGTFPIPGDLWKFDFDDPAGQYVPDWSPDTSMHNTTASLFSMCIMQNYFSPELCVGPTEPSGNVFVHSTYNWELYDPVADVHWDPSFAADLQNGSNVSYAHMPIFGERQRIQWRESLDETFAIVGNRGPRDGIDDPKSITYEIHGSRSQWMGNVIYNDNHVITASTFTPEGDDNLFKMEQGPDGLDSLLGITAAMTPEGPILDWD